MFKDSSLSDQIERDGFVLIETGIVEELDQIYAYISEECPLPDSEFYYSLISNSFEKNQQIRDFLMKIFYPFYEKSFRDYKIINQSFLSKPAHAHDELLLHQDWCYTDEKKYKAYNIWIPLADVDEENGALFFLRGSHLWFNNLRSASLPTARISSREFNDQIKTVQLKKGQAVLFHPAVFHGSYPNRSSKNRIIVTSTILSAEAPFLYYQKEQGSSGINVFHLDENTYLENLGSIAVGGDPAPPIINKMNYQHRVPTEKDLLEKL